MSFVQYSAASLVARKTCARLKLSGALERCLTYCPRPYYRVGAAPQVPGLWQLHQGYVEGYEQIWKQVRAPVCPNCGAAFPSLAGEGASAASRVEASGQELALLSL